MTSDDAPTPTQGAPPNTINGSARALSPVGRDG